MRWRWPLAVGGSGLLLVGVAKAYVRTTDPSTGVCLYWAMRKNLPWMINEKGSDDPPFDTLPPILAAVQRSFDTWQSQGCTDLTFAYRGTTSRTDVGYDPSRPDNINLLVWREVACEAVAPASDGCHQDGSCGNKYNCWDHSSGVIALTTTTYDKDTGELYDADIEFDGALDSDGNEFRFTATTMTTPICSPNDGASDECVSTDVQNTATHEIGHFIGLAHSPVRGSTMYASAAVGETSKRALSQDDIAGLCSIYPAGQPPSTCPAHSSSSLGPGSTSAGCGCGPGATDSAGFGSFLWWCWRRRRADRARRTFS